MRGRWVGGSYERGKVGGQVIRAGLISKHGLKSRLVPKCSDYEVSLRCFLSHLPPSIVASANIHMATITTMYRSIQLH